MTGGTEFDSKQYKVIVVDDEPDQLESFRLNFRRDFDLLLAPSGAEALELLRNNDAAVLLTDQRMPGLTGVEVLEQAKKVRPDTVRMVVTAFKDADSVLDAVNKGDVYRYVVKPWNADEMRITITNAISGRRVWPSSRCPKCAQSTCACSPGRVRRRR